jgi:hypothetical protein
MAASGPITYLAVEDQFPSVPRLASACHGLRECQARSACMSEHPAATAPAVARGNDLSFRPGQPAYRGQLWAPGSAAARGRGPDASLPGLAPSRIRRWCAYRVPADARDRVRAGCDTRPGTRRLPGSPHPGHRAAGMIPAQASPAPSPPWPGSDGAAPGIPGAAGIAWRDWRWRAASAFCGQPLVPTGSQSPVRIVSNHGVLAGVVFTFGADLGKWGLAEGPPTG